MKHPLLLLLCLLSLSASAQTITAKVIDSETSESIPYANILVNGSQSLITNGEGVFTIPEASAEDSSVITVSYLGFVTKQITVGDLKDKQLTIALKPAAFVIDNVNISNVKPDPNQIMAEVKKNLSKHYKFSDASKDMLFFRDSQLFKPKTLDIEIDKSTGFSKSALKTANAQIGAFTSKIKTHPPQEYSDMLCNLYRAQKIKDSKPIVSQKLDVIKATKLKDEAVSASFEDIEKNAAKLFLQHLDTTKFYRIKSGWFGSRDTVSLSKSYNEKKSKKKDKQPTSELTSSKTALHSFLNNSNLLYNKNFSFVSQPELYQYAYEGAILSDDNSFVYVLSFKPRKSKALYTGKLYVSESDFAVVRADYNLADGKKISGINLKLVLGVKQAENVSKGTLIYKPNPSGSGYFLQYASMEQGQYIYVNRPLKFIELSDEERDVVAFDFKVEGSIIDKTEFLNISRSEISEAAFEDVKEQDFAFIKLRKYDPSIWKDYTAIEPMEEMKRYAVPE